MTSETSTISVDEDVFKESFKKYKSWKKRREGINTEEEDSQYIDVVDTDELDEESTVKVLKRKEVHFHENQGSCKCGSAFFGLNSLKEWKVYEFNFPKGLIFIKNPFTSEGQRYWIAKCISDYPNKPHVTNMDNLKRINIDKSGENLEDNDEKQSFYKKLRWVTFGYHHDWDTKVYSDSYKCEFPHDLSVLTKYISNVLGFQDFNAEAAIVNYYHLDSTLSGHVDRSEVNQEAPLFSLSFGQTAVFLIGGRTKSVKPVGIFLRSGDIAIMTGESRFSYHGVPCILSTNYHPWVDDEIKHNAGELQTDSQSASKKPKLDVLAVDGIQQEISANCSICKSSSMHNSDPNIRQVLDGWQNFHSDYISISRINLNVRQVLFAGQVSLNGVKRK